MCSQDISRIIIIKNNKKNLEFFVKQEVSVGTETEFSVEILMSSYSYYYYSYFYSRQNFVRTSPPRVLMLQFCHCAHIFI